MCENENNCVVVNDSVPVSCNEVANAPCANTCDSTTTVFTNTDLERVQQHIEESEEFDRQLKAANEETDRFRELYTAVFGIVIEKQDIELLQKVNSKIAEIELKYIRM